jgi:multicomponent Na+:H+ antiporter subunit B
MTAAIPATLISLTADIVLLTMMIVIALAVVFTRSLLASILLMSIYSLVAAIWFVMLDAPDVAFTEAAVGAGVSTIVLLGATLLARGESERRTWKNVAAPLAVVLATGAALVYAASGLPDFGDPTSPANSHVGRTYLETTPDDIGIPNVVTAVLASYRGFDTLGETVVIFAASIGVALMLGFGERSLAEREHVVSPSDRTGEHHVVLRVTAKLLIPLIALYAFYVQFHGDLGAGGGFQAGVILAVAVILHALVFGLRDTMAAVKPGFARGVAALGVLLYAGVGIASIANGGGFLDYDRLFPPSIEAQIPDWILPSDHAHHWGQHFGIMLIELGVLFTVSATMVTIFYGFAGRSNDAPKEQGK